MNKSHIALLRSNYESACNAYLKAFCQKHGFSEAYWVADRVGEIADCNESYTFDMSTIRTDIDEDAPEEQLLEWYSYTAEADLFNLTTPQLPPLAPRMPTLLSRGTAEAKGHAAGV